MYRGKDAPARRQQIEQMDYPSFEIVEAGQTVPEEAEVCVVWVDDDKPIAKDFLDQMTKPLIASEDLRAVMHFWAGNAISLPRNMLDESAIHQGSGVQSLLGLLMPSLDSAAKRPNGRLHLAFSSTERLAPLSMDPVGFPS